MLDLHWHAAFASSIADQQGSHVQEHMPGYTGCTSVQSRASSTHLRDETRVSVRCEEVTAVIGGKLCLNIRVPHAPFLSVCTYPLCYVKHRDRPFGCRLLT